MNAIKIPVQAWILGLMPELASPGTNPTTAPAQQLNGLALGLALPAFWDQDDIRAALTVANKIWSRADIEFTLLATTKKTLTAPADAGGLWALFINRLSPKTGIAAAFVYDLPDAEGGWGGGRITVISGKKVEGALDGFAGRLLAHELGHILLNTPNHVNDSSNLMYGNRHPRVMTADLLDQVQVSTARTTALTLI